MIGYHRKTLCSLLDQIKLARENPFGNSQIWKTTQLIVLQKIVKLEDKMRECKLEIKAMNALRKNPNEILDKAASIKIKAQISKREIRLKKIKFVMDAYRSIGDAIAYTFIDKLDIKPQNFKQSPGFISKKDGLLTELQSFKRVFSEGYIAILNDITSTLKYCDLTFIYPGGFIPIEVKSSSVNNTRIKRQNDNASKIFKYLETDETENLYGVEGFTRRVEINSKEINYIKSINKLIKNSETTGNDSIEVEKGVYYYVSRRFENRYLEKKFKHLKAPLWIPVNDYKFCGQGYYPFSLSLESSNDYVDFLAGKYVIMLIIDLSVIEKFYSRKGYIFKCLDEGPFGFCLQSKNAAVEFPIIKISNHYFLRAATEFVSPRWLINDSIAQFTMNPKKIM